MLFFCENRTTWVSLKIFCCILDSWNEWKTAENGGELFKEFHYGHRDELIQLWRWRL